MDAKECCSQCPEHIKIQLKPLVAQTRSQADSLLFEIVIHVVPDYLIHVSGKKIDVNSNLRHRVNYPSNSAFPSSQSDLQHWQRWCQLWESSSQRKIQRLSQFHCGTHNKPSNLERERMHCSHFVFCTLEMISNVSQNVQVGWNWIQWDCQIPQNPQTAPHSQATNPAATQQNLELFASAIALCSVKELRALSPMSKCSLHWKTQPKPRNTSDRSLKKYKPTWFTKISVLNYNSAIQRFIILWRGHSQRSSADRLCLTLQTVQKLNPPCEQNCVEHFCVTLTLKSMVVFNAVLPSQTQQTQHDPASFHRLQNTCHPPHVLFAQFLPQLVTDQHFFRLWFAMHTNVIFSAITGFPMINLTTVANYV